MLAHDGVIWLKNVSLLFFANCFTRVFISFSVFHGWLLSIEYRQLRKMNCLTFKNSFHHHHTKKFNLNDLISIFNDELVNLQKKYWEIKIFSSIWEKISKKKAFRFIFWLLICIPCFPSTFRFVNRKTKHNSLTICLPPVF